MSIGHSENKQNQWSWRGKESGSKSLHGRWRRCT